MKKIMIADDHEMFRDGVASLIESVEGWKVAAKVSNGKEVIARLAEEPFDIVLLDINMPVMSGLEAATVIAKKFPKVKMLMLSMFNDAKNIQQVLKVGAKGYLLKDSSRKDLVEGITTVLEGGTYFVDEVKETLIASFRNDRTQGNVTLTDKEKMILSMICKEYTTQQIAENLNLSSHTVESHRKNLLAKTGAKSSIGLVKFAMDNGLG